MDNLYLVKPHVYRYTVPVVILNLHLSSPVWRFLAAYKWKLLIIGRCLVFLRPRC